ncbi:MAG: elongation factor Ts [Deltaproteobacteria bacterium RBG_19FT_COMBO_58_16]|nr:MAG: elongation factor Ts [Deltaproteobacteria bacterium RBG_19FT_COMBO_58_16]
MSISASAVKELREKTGAGIMDCKRALSTNNGDVEKAITFLREKGLAAAQKKAGRVAADGLVLSYIHGGGKVGVLVEVNCETDFVAKTDGFADLVRDIALHVAALSPQYVRREDVPADIIEKEKAIYAAQARESGKPEQVIQKMIDGKLEKFFKEVCLLEQPFVKNPDQSVEKLIVESVARLGENITVRRFARFKVGEGIEKETTDFASEVAAFQS